MSRWKEIRNTFVNEEENAFYIDAWKTNNPNEEGEVVAKVFIDTKEVKYLNKYAETDHYAQEMIQDRINCLS